MIRDAIAATRWYWPDIPRLGMVSFVNAKKLRQKEESEIGRCYLEAGFHHCGFTEGGLHAFQMWPGEMPAPQPPIGVNLNLEAIA